MDKDKTAENSKNETNQSKQSHNADPNVKGIKAISDHTVLFDRLRSFFVEQMSNNKLWFFVYSANLIYFLYALIFSSAESGMPLFPLIIFICIIFVQIYTDPIKQLPTEESSPEKKTKLEIVRSQQRHKWMIFSYSFMLLALVLTIYPFVNTLPDRNIEKLRAQPIAMFIGCSLDSDVKHLSCFKTRTENKPEVPSTSLENARGVWVINIGGYVNSCDITEDGQRSVCHVSDGLLVPLYFIILALMGGSISLTRRLPELQKQANVEYVATEMQPKLTQHEFREHLIFQIVQFISAPFLAILAYYLIEPSNTTNAVALAFTAGFASETILLMIRSITNKITPEASIGPRYGAVAGVITLDAKKPTEKMEVFLSESPQIHSTTDEQGFYMLSNVPVGEHSISIRLVSNGEILKKDTVKIERTQPIVNMNVEILK